MKQTKLRRRRVFRYAVLYFVLLIVFLALMVGPGVAGKYIPSSMFNMLDSTDLVQPTGLNNDDTRGRLETGTKMPGYSGIGTMFWTTTADAVATATLDRRASVVTPL